MEQMHYLLGTALDACLERTFLRLRLQVNVSKRRYDVQAVLISPFSGQGT